MFQVYKLLIEQTSGQTITYAPQGSTLKTGMTLGGVAGFLGGSYFGHRAGKAEMKEKFREYEKLRQEVGKLHQELERKGVNPDELTKYAENIRKLEDLEKEFND